MFLAESFKGTFCSLCLIHIKLTSEYCFFYKILEVLFRGYNYLKCYWIQLHIIFFENHKNLKSKTLKLWIKNISLYIVLQIFTSKFNGKVVEFMSKEEQLINFLKNRAEVMAVTMYIQVVFRPMRNLFFLSKKIFSQQFKQLNFD